MNHEFNPTQNQCSAAQVHAALLADHLNVAYWMFGRCETTREHHARYARSHLAKLCAELGFELTPLASQPEAQEAA